MDCQRFQQTIVGRLYEENSPEDDAALESHLAVCPACRTDLSSLARVRGSLRDGEPEVTRVPRVVVLHDRGRFRPSLLAASLLGAAILAGAAAGGGYAVLRAPGLARTGNFTQGDSEAAATQAGRLDAATEALIAKEVERRVAAVAVSRGVPPERAKATGGSSGPAVTSAELDAALARLERKVNGARAADLDYVMGQVTASEVRSGQRIGLTNQALRYVALASNPNVSEQ